MKTLQNIQEFIDKAPGDYEKCICEVAREAMRILDNSPKLINGYYPTENTAHNIIVEADNNIKAGGITGHMADYTTKLVQQCHIRGDEFFNSYHNKL